ncbi:hypothetical protein RM553_12630 [Zunongwangia sp. F363]|uniref:Core-binding (CB) domain-containing protein n=1 Tax=Autumnicola tepida TaxID=3075595 RepID=A0ABU3CBH2_9FLAO|nr:hypothetical protein [Zunongwangia sp. F363]MDT0643680.1 hypothetical protein [Zunongwangia sp. F363]
MKKERYFKIEPTSEPTYIKITLDKPQYSQPKLYIPTEEKNGKKVPTVKPGNRWYVWFLWRNPETDNLDIKIKRYKEINRAKTVKERKAIGAALIRATEIMLERGWNPLNKKVEKKAKSKVMTLEKAMDYALQLRSVNKKESTVADYTVRLEFFKSWAKKKGYLGLPVPKFDLEKFYEYYDYLLLEYKTDKNKPLSNASIENHKRLLSSLFTQLKNKRIIEHNFVKDIPKLEIDPQQNTPFTNKEIKRIREYLQENDPYLLKFIPFITSCLLRPREILRLQIKDLNVIDFVLKVETKTEILATVKITEKIKPVIESMQLEKFPLDYYVFTPEGRPGEWNSKLNSKVGYMGKRFAKVKEALGFGEEYGLYSFRHSSIGNIQENLQKMGYSETEIVHKIMPITRHKTEKAVRTYLRNLKKYTPQDHSELTTLEI